VCRARARAGYRAPTNGPRGGCWAGATGPRDPRADAGTTTTDPTPARPADAQYRPSTADRNVVQLGDTLASIAEQVGVGLGRLRAAIRMSRDSEPLPPGNAARGAAGHLNARAASPMRERTWSVKSLQRLATGERL